VVPWTWEDVVRSFVPTGSATLDIGTGGGEVLGRLVRRLGSSVAVDHQGRMAEVASRHLGARVGVIVADASQLPFRSERFDAVLERHAQP
jgi:ubiquinone/menaquinone biosynthesis C-methylase UbiE